MSIPSVSLELFLGLSVTVPSISSGIQWNNDFLSLFHQFPRSSSEPDGLMLWIGEPAKAQK